MYATILIPSCLNYGTMGHVTLVSTCGAEDGPKGGTETCTLVSATGSITSDDALGELGWRNRHLLDPFLSSNLPPGLSYLDVLHLEVLPGYKLV